MRPDHSDEQAAAGVDPSYLVRAGAISAPRQNLLNAAAMEEMLIARTLRDLAPLGKGGMLHFSERWFGYTVEQRAWLARHISPEFGQDHRKQIKDSIRSVSHKNLVWRQDRRGARLVQISAPRQNLLNAASMEEMLIARTSRDLAPLGKGGMLFFSETWFGYTVEQPAWLARP